MLGLRGASPKETDFLIIKYSRYKNIMDRLCRLKQEYYSEKVFNRNVKVSPKAKSPMLKKRRWSKKKPDFLKKGILADFHSSLPKKHKDFPPPFYLTN